jgi:hypothetical protein
MVEPFEYRPRLGVGLIHVGRHLHEVLPVTAGERHQYIMWARSAGLRAAQCPWCGPLTSPTPRQPAPSHP